MLNEAERENSALRIEMRKLIEPVVTDLTALQESVASLGNTIAENANVNYAGITNYLDNSMPEWSKDAYANTVTVPGTAGDGNLEVHNFFHIQNIDEHEELIKDPAHALKAVGHTGLEVDADVPKWDKINGTMSLGWTTNRWDIYTPLPYDIGFPGQTFIFQVEVKLVSGVAPDTQFFVGLYDNTYDAGPPEQKRKFIEGGDFTITGEIFGTPGTRHADYRIVAKTDSGEEAISNILAFTDAPNEFNGANHPRIYFAGVAGFIQFLIYRRIHGESPEYVHQYTVNNTIEGSYFDMGKQPLAVVSGWPPVSTTVPRAYAVTSKFVATADGWVRYTFTIFMPTTYNRGKTDPGMQYLRFGLTAPTDTPGQVLIRRLGLSQGDGAWARSSHDTQTGVHSTPSTSADGAGSGSGDGGGGINPPPPPGEGDIYPPFSCVLTDSMIDIAGGEKLPLGHLANQRLDGGGPVYGRVRRLKLAHTSRIYRVTSANGLTVGAAPDHPFITSPEDPEGTLARKLKKRFDRGEYVSVLTRPDDVIEPSKIVSMDEEFGDFLVGTPLMTGSHLYFANGFLSHNKAAWLGGGIT